MIGSADNRLVILRGNSGSGKSTVARRLRERLGRGVAWIEQDHLRRVVLGEHDRPGMPNIGLIDQTCRYALDAGYHAIVDGILITDHYRDMLLGLIDDHRGASVVTYFDIPLEETLRRHRGRPLAAEVADDRLRSWYRRPTRSQRRAGGRSAARLRRRGRDDHRARRLSSGAGAAMLPGRAAPLTSRALRRRSTGNRAGPVS